eukprot:TRINITY_DN977_c0_g1_i1.p1 TRINITY_DN977_c0_g1~~TRINITY_DN977_c0_g1_i1.p1  ORF type:complete len:133 (-),score=20.19 TRINITY_DN977_c0_g1_i1:1214-1612(-)
MKHESTFEFWDKFSLWEYFNVLNPDERLYDNENICSTYDIVHKIVHPIYPEMSQVNDTFYFRDALQVLSKFIDFEKKETFLALAKYVKEGNNTLKKSLLFLMDFISKKLVKIFVITCNQYNKNNLYKNHIFM